MLLNKENEENISRDSFFDQIFENIPSIHYDNIMKYKERMDNQDTLNAEEKEILNKDYKKLYVDVSINIPNTNLAQNLLIRYNLLSKSFIAQEEYEVLNKDFSDKEEDPNIGIYFVDEWLRRILDKKEELTILNEIEWMHNSNISKQEINFKRTEMQNNEMMILFKEKSSQLKAEVLNIKNKINNIKLEEFSLKVNDTSYDVVKPILDNKTIHTIVSNIRNIIRFNKELQNRYTKLNTLKKNLLSKKVEEKTEEKNSQDQMNLKEELISIFQMEKMSEGTTGNHFPIIISKYLKFHTVVHKKDIIKLILKIENIDPKIFIRTYRSDEYRVVPKFILLPCYGSTGICWEAIPQYNRKLGAGKIALPLYSTNPELDILNAFATLRWETEKNKNGYYWMEEGFTGLYYSYCMEEKIKNPFKSFVLDYINWIKYESQGIQKLNNKVRTLFWFHMPFPVEIKNDLKEKGFFYRELYKKDMVKNKGTLT